MRKDEREAMERERAATKVMLLLKKKNARSVMKVDGRPQGAQPRIHTAPVPTIYDETRTACATGRI